MLVTNSLSLNSYNMIFHFDNSIFVIFLPSNMSSLYLVSNICLSLLLHTFNCVWLIFIDFLHLSILVFGGTSWVDFLEHKTLTQKCKKYYLFLRITNQYYIVASIARHSLKKYNLFDHIWILSRSNNLKTVFGFFFLIKKLDQHEDCTIHSWRRNSQE